MNRQALAKASLAAVWGGAAMVAALGVALLVVVGVLALGVPATGWMASLLDAAMALAPWVGITTAAFVAGKGASQ